MNRFKASLLHLFGSACVVATVFLFVRLVWYPGRLFEAAHGIDLMMILVLVDVVLGPLITLIIFSPAKPSLKFDLITVVVLQAGFLMFGIWSIFLARPAYIPFVENRFYLVTANEIEPDDLKKAKDPSFQSLPLTGPVMAGTKLPDDPEMQEKILFANLFNSGIQHLPQYYVDYGQAAEDVRTAATTAQDLAGKMKNASSEDLARLVSYEARKRAEGKNVRFVRLLTKTVILYVAVDEISGAVVEIL